MQEHRVFCGGTARPAALLKALASTKSLSLQERRDLWSVYRGLRRTAQTPQHWQCHLHALRQRECTWPVLSLALKLARVQVCVALRLSRQKGSLPPKALTQEYFALLRHGLRPGLPEQNSGTSDNLASCNEEGLNARGIASATRRDATWTVVCDASARNGRCGAGVVLHDPCGQIRAELAVAVCAKNALEAELLAAEVALDVALSFGVSHLCLQTDALAVVRAFEGALTHRHCVQEGLLLRKAAQLQSFLAIKVPRLETMGADRLAALITQA